MVEVLVMYLILIVMLIIHKDVKKTVFYGILNVRKVFMPLDVVSVLLNVWMEWQMLVFLARNNHMEEELVLY